MTEVPAEAIDRELASALRRERSPETLAAVRADPQAALERIHYHGLAGLLTGLQGWPAVLAEALRREALARAMWELRHRQHLAALLEALHARQLRSLLLKGTALAYGFYDEPAHRTRGDTDLWVAPADLAEVREVLSGHGFTIGGEALEPEGMQLEQCWTRREVGGHAHDIDLHWSAINSLCLRSLFDFERCWARRKPLPALGAGASALGDSDALLHTAVHRRLHVVSPYEVDGRTYYGGDRLIWAFDIHLLAAELGAEGLSAVAEQAEAIGLGEALGEALALAQRQIGTSVPEHLLGLGNPTRRNRTAHYLAGGQVRRALLDLQALQGTRARLSAIGHRIMPSRRFLEARYGDARPSGLIRLLTRRIRHFLRKRPASSSR